MQPGAAAPELARGAASTSSAPGSPSQKWPEELRVVADFPRTPSGKIKKFVLRDELRKEAIHR